MTSVNTKITLSKICASGTVQEVEIFLRLNPQSIHELTEHKEPLLHAALHRSGEIAYPMCEALLRHGANPDMKGGSELTVLECAARWGQEDCVELFVRSGVKVDKTPKVELGGSICGGFCGFKWPLGHA